jgi:hypothetical protein
MAHQIVATSVPRGLDGVSGYQTVLKSAGIPPRVFDRLKARSGYSHRYPHGDSRNPVVFIHRIEELAGSRWHVLGCIRDAGSDHTGRSNFLAHMLAIDTAEARGKPGGPAAAAMARGCFLDKWDRPPEPTAPAKTLVAADRPAQPGDMPAWNAAGVDPGLAGDLAAAAMANQKVVMVTRPSDDVLALFVDAMRLVEPSKRWSVTFSTCAIEDFDGTWKAVRADLAESKDLRDGKATLIDLTTNPRGSATPYAQFARGEIDVLPWQKPTAAPEPEQEAEEPAIADASKKIGIEKRGPNDSKKLQKTYTAKADEGSGRERRRRYEEEVPPRAPWHAIAIGGLSLLLIATLVAIPFRDELTGLLRSPEPRPIESEPVAVTKPDKPRPIDAKDTPEYRAATKLRDARKSLENGVAGKTNAHLCADAKALLTYIDDLRRGHDGKPPLQIRAKDGAERDPRFGVEEVITVCNRVAGVLESDTGLMLKDFENATSDFKAAADRLALLKTQVDDLAADELTILEKQKRDGQRKRRQDAFVALQSLVKAVRLPTAAAASGVDIGETSRPAGRGVNKIDLGPFAPADLVEPTFRLAVPRDTVEGGEFRAQIVTLDGEGDPRWEIRYLPSAVALDGGKQTAKPRPLAYLVACEGRLFLEVPQSNELWMPPFALLRRSVLLVESKDPEAPKAPAVVHEIRLIEPKQVQSLVIDPFAERQQELAISPPAGIARKVRGPEGHGTCELPISGLRFEAAFPKSEKVSFELAHAVNEDGKEDSDVGIREWRVALAPPDSDLQIQAVIKLSLPQAMMTVRTDFGGKKAHVFSKAKVKEFFINEPEGKLRSIHRQFKSRVDKGLRFRFTETQTKQADILAWFEAGLASQQKTGMGMPMPNHETVKQSFSTFLQEKYDNAAEDKRRALPETWDDFLKRCQDVRDEDEWKSVFVDRIDKWSDWFWPQFEKQWQEHLKLFQGALSERHTIQIKAITSLAYDEKENVFEVPLVIGDTTAQPNGWRANGAPAKDRKLGNDGKDDPVGDGKATPPAAAGSGNSVGLD